MSGTAIPTRRSLLADLNSVTTADAHRLRRKVEGAKTDAQRLSLRSQIDQAKAKYAARRAHVPALIYPQQLPVSERRAEISRAISDNQVVIIAGETGSGKTTQIPKICLDLGRGIDGMIGHTQPRRLAARAVAERLATETNTELGDAVGYTVRFTDKSAPHTLIKVMTDGILLNEITRDRLLRAYDTIIIDEAHERSLNIDFLLGYLKQILPRRPDLKIIITSATIDPERFAQHFDSGGTPAPILSISGRTYPVEIRYRPSDADDSSDEPEAVCRAIDELSQDGPGDILVFLSGEREIRDTADAVTGHITRSRHLHNTEVLPLFGRLSAADQHRVFSPHSNRRIILSTNVAETSLTVPGIRYVIDAGTARISRYSARTKVQRLPIEPISQASARQRSGRCGRVADGIAIRLYSQDDFESRPQFTDPEILRTNLASVILKMAVLGFGDPQAFPFVQPPEERAIRDGFAVLRELGAIKNGALTPVGRQLAEIPVDPRMARMLVHANTLGCLHETVVIVAALSTQDVRERPEDYKQAASESHSRFNEPSSDFLSLLRLWDYIIEQQKMMSTSAFRRMCKKEFLNWVRIREWQDLYAQLRSVCSDLGWRLKEVSPDNRDADRIHQSLLAGLLSHIGVREADKSDYLGARNARFALFPGSALFKKPPTWVMSAELVETSRLWGRVNARIDPTWAEPIAADLVKRQYSEPRWSTKGENVIADEKVTLYGVPIVARRTVSYGKIDREVAREIFIRHALVDGQWRTTHKFFHHNRKLLAQAEEWEHKARRRDIVVDEDTLFDFYDKRVGPEVVSGRHFDTWWKSTRRSQPHLLDFTVEEITNSDASDIDPRQFPPLWKQNNLTFDLSYQFEPGTIFDGVTVRIPIGLLAQVSSTGFDWLVPGLRHELVTALIKTLPKDLRRRIIPAPNAATDVLTSVQPRTEPIVTMLARELSSRIVGASVATSDLRPQDLPPHLRITFAACDESGEIIDYDKSLAAVKTRLSAQIRQSLAPSSAKHERPAATEWTETTFGTIERVVEHTVNGQTAYGYPSLAPVGDGSGRVLVKVLAHEDSQRAAMLSGLTALLILSLPKLNKNATTGLSTQQRMALSQAPYKSLTTLLEDCRHRAIEELIYERTNGGHDLPWTAADFDDLKQSVTPLVARRALTIVHSVSDALLAYTELRATLDSKRSLPQLSDAVRDVREQWEQLIFPGFVGETHSKNLANLSRYAQATTRRLVQLPANLSRDLSCMDVLDRVYGALDHKLGQLTAGRRVEVELESQWMIEELRVSLFAQQIGTAFPISEKRMMLYINGIQ